MCNLKLKLRCFTETFVKFVSIHNGTVYKENLDTKFASKLILGADLYSLKQTFSTNLTVKLQFAIPMVMVIYSNSQI